MKTITARQLRDVLNDKGDWTLIDTLPREHSRRQHIPGAHAVPFEEENFVRRVEGIVGTRDDPVIVYCANDHCDLSPKAGRALEQGGFTNVIDFEGGIEAWTEAGYPTERGANQ